MILLCLVMILLESGITMIQLKGNMEREHDEVIKKTSLQTVLSFPIFRTTSNFSSLTCAGLKVWRLR